MDNIILSSKFSMLPENLKSEVADFIDFLISKTKAEKVVSQKVKPSFGSGKGMFIMHDDFDAPLDDFKEYIQ